MEVNDKLEPFNPWKVEDIDQFLNYCCPECDSKQKTKSEFIVHAIDVHPNSRNYLPLFDFDEEKDQEQIIGPKDKTNFSDSELIEDEDHKSIIEPSMEKAKMDILASKSLQDNLPLLDFVTENDQCDTYRSDFEFREDISCHYVFFGALLGRAREGRTSQAGRQSLPSRPTTPTRMTSNSVFCTASNATHKCAQSS